MRKFNLFLIILAVAIMQPAFAQPDKVRVIIMADIGHDPDDEQQVVHLLVCSNEFDLEGIIAVTGRYFRPDPKDTVKTLMSELFDFILDGYEKVYPRLLQHSEGYKSPQYMRSIVEGGQQGNGMKDVGSGRSSKGSKLIIDAVLNDDPRPLYILSNGGMNTLAQALYDYRSESTKEELQAFISKIRVYDNSGQDESGAWICHGFPDIFYIRGKVQNRSFGGPTNNNLGPHCWKPFEYSPWGQHQWASEHIQNFHGALGELYPDRKVDGKYQFMGGGGVIPWAGLINPGLSDISHPSWGGWSGRYTAKKNFKSLLRFPDYSS